MRSQLIFRYNKDLIFIETPKLSDSIIYFTYYSCYDKKETLEALPVAESKDDPVIRRHRRDSQTEPLSPQRLSQTIGPSTKYNGNTIRNTSDLYGNAQGRYSLNFEDFFKSCIYVPVLKIS